MKWCLLTCKSSGAHHWPGCYLFPWNPRTPLLHRGSCYDVERDERLQQLRDEQQQQLLALRQEQYYSQKYLQREHIKTVKPKRTRRRRWPSLTGLWFPQLSERLSGLAEESHSAQMRKLKDICDKWDTNLWAGELRASFTMTAAEGGFSFFLFSFLLERRRFNSSQILCVHIHNLKWCHYRIRVSFVQIS